MIPKSSLADLIALVRARAASVERPLVIALDGHSGAGKSNLARALTEALDGVCVDGDAFFAGGTGVDTGDVSARIARCIDWRAQREVLGLLRSGAPASLHAFDWEAFDGSREETPTTLAPRPFVILEGVYSARPELADLVDVRVLVVVPPAVRWARLLARAGGVDAWTRQWIEAEDAYFAQLGGETSFDLVVAGDR